MNTRLVTIVFVLLLAAMVAFGLWIQAAKPEPAELIPTDPDVTLSVPVTIYAYDPHRDQDASENVLCSAQGLVPVSREVPKSDNVLGSTLALLFTDALTEEERARGLTTNFPLTGVRLEEVTTKGEEVTVVVRDPNHTTSGGSCRVNVMRSQIEATAKQFDPQVHVRYSPEGVFEP
jgi:hypothetical protein